ncbi:hypothetical protein EI015_25915 [Escherichia coli]|nr:hypothetical protein [Escherichia coli]
MLLQLLVEHLLLVVGGKIYPFLTQGKAVDVQDMVVVVEEHLDKLLGVAIQGTEWGEVIRIRVHGIKMLHMEVLGGPVKVVQH